MSSSGNPASGPRSDRLLTLVQAVPPFLVAVVLVMRSSGPASAITFGILCLVLAAPAYFIYRGVAALSDEALDVEERALDSERLQLEQEKKILLHGIKEFEADAATGKVDAADYAILRRSAEARAVEIIRVLKESDEHWRREARRLAQKRLSTPLADPPPAASPKAEVAPAPSPAAAQAAPVVPRGELALAALFDDRPVELSLVGDLRVCAACQAKSPVDARYCTGCGRPKEERS